MEKENPPPELAYELPDDDRPASAATPPEEILERTLPSGAAPSHDPYAALRYPDFVSFVVGWVISVIGSQILEVAVGWDLYQRTSNPLTLGWVGLVSALPIILLCLPAGHLADRSDRRLIIFSMQLLSCACAVALGVMVLKSAPLVAIYAMLLLSAVGKAVGWPARSAMLPSLVPTGIFANAIMWNTSGFQIAAMAGPALGGLIIAWRHTAAYFVAAACGLAFVVALLGIKPRPATAARKEPATLKSLAAGVKFVFSTKIILAIITLDLFAVLLGGATYLLPIFARDILKAGPTGFGWLRAAPALGALLGALAMAHLPPMKRAGLALLWAVVGFGVATIIFGLSKCFWLSIVMLFLTGVFDNVSVLVRHTLVQVLTPDSMRGRVSAVNSIFVGASNELGGFESGVTARLLGPITSVVAGGIGTIAVVIWVALTWPQVRAFGSLVDAKALEEDPEPLKK
jgi:MFS family permease